MDEYFMRRGDKASCGGVSCITSSDSPVAGTASHLKKESFSPIGTSHKPISTLLATSAPSPVLE